MRRITDTDRQISRRTLLKGSGMTVAGLALGGVAAELLAACAAPSTGSASSPVASAAASASSGAIAKGTGEVVYAGFGGTYEQGIKAAYFAPFQEATGIKVQITTGASDVAKIQAMVQANRTEFDIVDATGPGFGQLLAKGLLQQVDFNVIDTSGLDKRFVGPYGVGSYFYSHNIYWNTRVIKGELTSWADVWDAKRFPGKRGFLRLPWYTLEVALLADGVPIEKLYPLDVDRAFKSLDRIKPNAVFQDLNTLTNLVTQQEVVTGDLNLARVQQIIRDGVPLAYNWKQNVVDMERFVVPKGAPNRDNAMRVIAFILHPDRQLAALKNLGYAPTLKAAVDKVDLEQAKNLPGTPATLPDGFLLDADWWAKNGDTVQRRYNDWLLI